FFLAYSSLWESTSLWWLVLLTSDFEAKCPPCFNCLLPAFTCECNPYNGQCNCPAGCGGIDRSTPRVYCRLTRIVQNVILWPTASQRLRDDGKSCECRDGWGGINCNVLVRHCRDALEDALRLFH
ncbi:hypothetical protein JOM56_007176, partial [Amanita muscaria]